MITDWSLGGKWRREQVTWAQRAAGNIVSRRDLWNAGVRSISRHQKRRLDHFAQTARRGGAKSRPCSCCTWTPPSLPVTDPLPSRHETYWLVKLQLSSEQPPCVFGEIRSALAKCAASGNCAVRRATGRARLGPAQLRDCCRVHCFSPGGHGCGWAEGTRGGPKHSNYSAGRGGEGEWDERGGTGLLVVLFHWLIGYKPTAKVAYDKTLNELISWINK